jgi:hypothetical protein
MKQKVQNLLSRRNCNVQTFIEVIKWFPWSSLGKGILWCMGNDWKWRSGFAVVAVALLMFFCHVLGIPVTAMQIVELLLLGALLVAIFWPDPLVQYFIPEPKLWMIRATRISMFVIGAILAQSVETRRWQIAIIVTGLIASAAYLHKRRPKTARKLWEAVPILMLLVYGPPLLLMRSVEFDIRLVNREEDKGRYIVQTTYGAHADAEIGETFENNDDPTLGKYRADDLQGILANAHEKKLTVGAYVTGIRVPWLGWYRNIIWAWPLDLKPDTSKDSRTAQSG